MKNIKLAIIISHPIQYYSPVFELLAKSVSLKVFYTNNAKKPFDKKFQRNIEWDISLLEGYEYEFLSNCDNCIKIHQYQPTHLLIYGWASRHHLKIIYHFKTKAKICFRGDSNLLKKTTIVKNTLKSLALKWIYSNIDKVFYVGTANKAYYKKYGLREDQLIYVPHSVDNQRFAESHTKDGLALRRKLNISEKEILILFAGKFCPTKNPLLLLRAFISISRHDVSLLFVGNGRLEHQLKSIVRKHRLKKVHFLPFQNQSKMPEVYHACDLFCMPSLHETWGLGVNEAMSAGKAILSSNTVGCSIDLISQSNGAIFENNNIQDLRRKLLQMTESKVDLQIKGEVSKILIRKWSLEKQIEAISYGIQQ